MRVPSCSICGHTATDVGPLCISECAWEPGRPWAECRRCTAEGVLERESLRAIREDADMWADHLQECSWCHDRRGLIPSLLLGQACSARRRENEAKEAA